MRATVRLAVIGAVLFGSGFVITVLARPQAAPATVPVATGTAADATARIVAAAQAVPATLDDAGRATVQFPFEGPQKTRWSNLPSPMFERRGGRLADLTAPQRAAVMKLLATALSPDGYQKVLNIMEGDEVLRQNGGGRGSRGAGPPQTAAPPTSACRARRWSSSTRRRAASITSTRSIATRRTTMERRLRAGSVVWLALLAGSRLALGTTVSAHRLDEYLQAARLSIGAAGVQLELSLTPGIAVADAVVRDIDVNGDGVLSTAERGTYAQRVLSGLSLRVDDGTVPLLLAAVDFPAAAALRSGDAVIVLRFDARPPRLTAGAHRVAFRNGNATHGAVYLANALLPDDRRVAITGMEHAMDQSGLTVAFTVRP